jgi:hypothetical protein
MYGVRLIGSGGEVISIIGYCVTLLQLVDRATWGMLKRIMAAENTFDYGIKRRFLEAHAEYVSGRCG